MSGALVKVGPLARLSLKATAVVSRAFGLRDEAFYRYLLGGMESHAGKAVTVDTALQLATVWACVRLISETIATLPCVVHRIDSRGYKTPAPEHSLYEILHDQPNADMTSVEFWTAMIACVLLWGNAFAEVMRNDRGTVIALVPLPPDRVLIRRNVDGTLTYLFTPLNGGGVIELAEDQIFHIKGFSTNGYLGLSVIAYARHSFGAAMATEEASSKIFANGMRPSGYISVPQVLTQDQRTRAEALVDRFKGSANLGKVPFLEAGWTYQQLTIPPEDAQMLQTREFAVEEVARWFNVPAHMIGHTTKSTSWGTGLEQQQLGFLAFNLRSHLTRVEKAIRRHLIAPAERRMFYAEFNVEGLLRADSAARAAFYSVMVQNGIYARNEIRALENLPPLPGGDILTAQVNMAPVDTLGHPAPQQSIAPQGDQANAA